MGTALTFDEMESKADRTLAVVLWAKNVKNMFMAAGWMALLDQTIKGLVQMLSHDNRLAGLSDEQAVELVKKLQELHSQLDFMLRRNTTIQWRTKMLFATSLEGIEGSTEDLADIIEDLILSCNPEFRAVLVECVKGLPSIHSAELIGSL